MRIPIFEQEQPKCPRCGSTEWEYAAVDRNENIICCDYCTSWDPVSEHLEKLEMIAESIEADRQYDQWKEEQYG